MDLLFDSMADYAKSKLIDGIMWVLTGLFDSVNEEVGSVATQVAISPADFVPGVYPLIKSTSETALMPIAGMVLTFIACYELIQLVVAHNNLSNFDTWIFMKWLLKTFVAVMAITHCFDFTMAIFDVTGHVCAEAGSFITESTAVTGPQLRTLRATLESMTIGEILPLYAEVTALGAGFKALTLIVFVVVYGRMIEIYMLTSMAPVPFSTFGNREMSHIGQNYVKSLLAIGFQGFLILIVMGIYAVLVQNISISDDIAKAMWSLMGYNILLIFSLFKTGTLSKRVFSAQ